MAGQLFRDGCACSQAVLVTYAEPLGLPRQTALQMAAGFAGGMRMAGTCGAVTGALMVLGLRHAGDTAGNAAGRAAVYARVSEFTKRFQARYGSVTCKDLLGCDISTTDGLKQAQERGLFRTLCPGFVEGAGTILDEMEAEGQRPPGGGPA